MVVAAIGGEEGAGETGGVPAGIELRARLPGAVLAAGDAAGVGLVLN